MSSWSRFAIMSAVKVLPKAAAEVVLDGHFEVAAEEGIVAHLDDTPVAFGNRCWVVAAFVEKRSYCAAVDFAEGEREAMVAHGERDGGGVLRIGVQEQQAGQLGGPLGEQQGVDAHASASRLEAAGLRALRVPVLPGLAARLAEGPGDAEQFGEGFVGKLAEVAAGG